MEMGKNIIIAILTLTTAYFLLTAAQNRIASNFVCRTNKFEISYCRYIGKIERLYLNTERTFIAYFENKINLEDVEQYGFEVTSDRGAAMTITQENETTASLIYESLLEAKIHEKEVTIHMRASDGTFLQIDRLWID